MLDMSDYKRISRDRNGPYASVFDCSMNNIQRDNISISLDFLDCCTENITDETSPDALACDCNCSLSVWQLTPQRCTRPAVCAENGEDLVTDFILKKKQLQ